jgi:hypothetical protein
MTIYLHIGSHKTGTTSIQRYLSRNRDAFASQGIWYPHIAELLADAKNSASHLNIARSLDANQRPKIYSKDDLRLMFKALAEKSSHFNSTIISAEAFWRIGFTRPPENNEDHDTYIKETWESKAKSISEIRELLGVNTNTTVVAVLRERAAYIQSSYSEFILATLYNKNIHKFIDYIQHIYDYNRQLEAWQQEFPVAVMSYEKLRSQGDLTNEFIKMLVGPFANPEDQGKPQKHYNPGHAIPCVAFKRFLNGIPNLSKEHRNKIYDKGHRRFKRSAGKGIPKLLQSINSWLTTEEIEHLQNRFSTDDHAIRANFCKDFVSGSASKLSDRQASVVPITKADEYLCLGWLLSKQPPSLEWFSNPNP